MLSHPPQPTRADQVFKTFIGCDVEVYPDPKASPVPNRGRISGFQFTPDKIVIALSVYCAPTRNDWRIIPQDRVEIQMSEVGGGSVDREGRLTILRKDNGSIPLLVCYPKSFGTKLPEDPPVP